MFEIVSHGLGVYVVSVCVPEPDDTICLTLPTESGQAGQFCPRFLSAALRLCLTQGSYSLSVESIEMVMALMEAHLYGASQAD